MWSGIVELLPLLLILAAIFAGCIWFIIRRKKIVARSQFVGEQISMNYMAADKRLAAEEIQYQQDDEKLSDEQGDDIDKNKRERDSSGG